MLAWIRSFFEQVRGGATHGPGPDRTPAGLRVIMDEACISLEEPGGAPPRTMLWADLDCVEIVTSNAGPSASDLFWHLSAAGECKLVVPLGIAGEHDLLKVMQRRLDDFDNMAVVEAMGSTENARFHVWPARPSRDERTPVPSERR